MHRSFWARIAGFFLLKNCQFDTISIFRVENATKFPQYGVRPARPDGWFNPNAPEPGSAV